MYLRGGGYALFDGILDFIFGPVDGSGGPRMSRKAPVPDVRGVTVADARSTLASQGFKGVFHRLEEDPAPVMGLVVEQIPAPGTDWVRARAVSLSVLHPHYEAPDRP